MGRRPWGQSGTTSCSALEVLPPTAFFASRPVAVHRLKVAGSLTDFLARPSRLLNHSAPRSSL